MNKLNKTQEKKVYKSALLIEKFNPDLFYFLKDFLIKSSPDIKTACIYFSKSEKKFIILINDTWLDNFDEYNLSAIIEHELHHAILNHLFSGLENKKLANIAQDCIINDLGYFLKDRTKLNQDLSRGCFLSEISRDLKAHKILGDYESLDLKLHDSKMVYEYLKLLPERKSDNYQTLDEHNQDLENNQDLEKIESSKDAENYSKAILSGENKPANEKLQKIGKDSAQFKIFFDELNKNNRIKNFKNSISGFFSSSKDSKPKKTIKRPSRRFNFLPIGKTKNKTQKIKLCLDLSGSMMSDETLQKIKVCIDTALNQNFTVDLIGGDTKKTIYEKNIKKNFDRSKITGGGGTELKFFFQNDNDETIKENLTYVIVTDGQFNQSDLPLNIPKKQFLFLCTESDNVFNYKTIKI